MTTLSHRTVIRNTRLHTERQYKGCMTYFGSNDPLTALGSLITDAHFSLLTAFCRHI